MLLRGIAVLSLVLAAVVCYFGQLALWLFPVVFAAGYLIFLLIAFAFLVSVCKAVDLEKPQEHDSKFYRTVMNLYIEALVSLVLVRVHLTGKEKLPAQGRFLLVCNHLFLADPGVLLYCFPDRELAFITKKENQSMFVVGKIMHKTLCQPLDRENDRQALKCILKCIQLIKDDEVSIGVFPEGYTSKDGFLHPFRPGAFKIAQKTGVPIVVCTIRNTRMIFKNLAKLKHTDVDVHVVDVIQPEDIKGKTTIEVSDMVYEKMIADLGESFRYSVNG